MEKNIKKTKGSIQKQAEELFEVDEDSDIVVHEKLAKDKKFRSLR